MIRTRSIVTLESKVFDKTVREQKVETLVIREAKEFKRLTQTRMIESKPAGVIVDRRRVSRFGPNFIRRHQRSARGQRPAIETGTLLNAVDDKQTAPNISEVFIQPKPNTETGTPADQYAEFLQGKLDRPIESEQDAAEAEQKMLRDANAMLLELI